MQVGVLDDIRIERESTMKPHRRSESPSNDSEGAAIKNATVRHPLHRFLLL
jgi:hypothetical protein